MRSPAAPTAQIHNYTIRNQEAGDQSGGLIFAGRHTSSHVAEARTSAMLVSKTSMKLASVTVSAMSQGLNWAAKPVHRARKRHVQPEWLAF